MGLFNLFKSKELLEWQNTLLEKPVSRLIMSEKQLRSQTYSRVENNMRIIKDGIKILNETTKPDTYFDRLDLMINCINDLLKFERYVDFRGSTPSEAMVEFVEQKQISIHQFLVRYFTAILDKAESLKTDKGKLNQYQKFYDSLQPYYSVMDADNIDYIETKYKAYTRLIKKGQE